MAVRFQEVRIISVTKPYVRQDRRARILQAAIDAFGVHGFNGVSTREIAMAAGVGDTLLFYYFKGKADLYIAAIRVQLERMHVGLQVAIGGALDLEERLRRYATTYLDYFFEYEPGLTMLLHDCDMVSMPAEIAEQVLQDSKVLVRVPLVEILSDGVRLGQLRAIDVELCSHAIIGILLQFVRMRTRYPNISRTAMVSQVMDYYYLGLLPSASA